MDNTFQLESLSIRRENYGENKGKCTGSVTFGNGSRRRFTIELTPDRTQQYLRLIAEEVVTSAKELGSQIEQSMKPETQTEEI